MNKHSFDRGMAYDQCDLKVYCPKCDWSWRPYEETAIRDVGCLEKEHKQFWRHLSS